MTLHRKVTDPTTRNVPVGRTLLFVRGEGSLSESNTLESRMLRRTLGFAGFSELGALFIRGDHNLPAHFAKNHFGSVF